MVHLVLDARLKVTQKGDWFLALKLIELHRSAPQVVIQLGYEDGSGSTLILGGFIACRTTGSTDTEKKKSKITRAQKNIIQCKMINLSYQSRSGRCKKEPGWYRAQCTHLQSRSLHRAGQEQVSNPCSPPAIPAGQASSQLSQTLCAA